MENYRKNRYETRSANNRIKKAADERIENVEGKTATKVNQKDVQLSVPFRLASKLNQDTNLRKSQNNIRKQFCAYVEGHFEEFVECYKNTTDPIIRARMFLEVAKMVIPRPKDYGPENEEGSRRDTLKRLFGGQRAEA